MTSSLSTHGIASARSLLLVLALAFVGAPVHAQQDEFDGPSPTATPRPTATPSLAAPPDTAFTDEAASAVVRVIAVAPPSLAPAASSCARGRIATAVLVSGTGLRLEDGKTVVVARELVAHSFVLAVHGSDSRGLRLARVVSVDEQSGLALLRLEVPEAPGALAVGGETPVPNTGLTMVARLPTGALVRGPARLDRVVSPDELVASVDALSDDHGRVVFRRGRPFGVLGRPYDLANPSVRRIVPLTVLTRLASAAPSTTSASSPVLERAFRTLLRLAMAGTEAERCQVLADPDLRDFALPAGAALDDLDVASLVALAALEWNRTVASAPEPGEEHASYELVHRAFLADVAQARVSGFALALEQLRVSREAVATERARVEAERERRAAEETAARERREAEAEAERTRREDEARLARERRLNLPLTYYAALSTGFSRDGSIGLGGAGLSGGLFATVPKLRATGSFRAGLAFGASMTLAANEGFLGVLSLDVGASMRFGGSNGGFLLVAYAPAVLSSAIGDGPRVTPSGFRIGSGVAIGRRVVYLGYRVLTPRNDYSLHLLELGVAFRHGPTAPAVSGVASR